VTSAVRGSTAVASVSSKEGTAANALFAGANGSGRYLQPTGSLGREDTFQLIASSDAMACNFNELRRLAAFAGIAPPDVNEEDPRAPTAAMDLVMGLRARGISSVHAALCTLGKQGSVAADWTTGRIHRIRIELRHGSAGVETCTGAGDRFLAQWIHHREMRRQGGSPGGAKPVPRPGRPALSAASSASRSGASRSRWAPSPDLEGSRAGGTDSSKRKEKRQGEAPIVRLVPHGSRTRLPGLSDASRLR
jgi:hypothetical protein